MKVIQAFSCFALVAVMLASQVRAEVTVSGDVAPNDPATWDANTTVSVGEYGSGTLNITNGGVVTIDRSYIALYPGSTGVATVDGNGSTWTNADSLYVGNYGSGTLNITNGGAVTADYSHIASYSDSTSEATVHGDGSTWTNSASSPW